VNTFTWIYQVSLVFVVYTQFVTIMLGDKGWITTCFRWTGKKFIFNTLVLKVQTLKPSKVIKLFFTKYLTMYDLYTSETSYFTEHFKFVNGNMHSGQQSSI